MACQQKVLDDLQKPLQYPGVVLTVGTSRAPIREAIARSGLTNEQTAERVGISAVTLSRWLNGHSDPGFDALDKLARELGETIVLTFGAHESAPPPQWATGLQRGISALLENAGISPGDERDKALARAVAEDVFEQQSQAHVGAPRGTKQ